MNRLLQASILVVLLPSWSTAQQQTDLKQYRAGLESTVESSTALARYLEIGLNRRRYSDSDVQQAERELPSSIRSDPAFRHARGLVLLQRRQMEDAVMAFESNRGGVDQPYLPSWKALIVHHLIQRKYSVGFELLEEYVELQQKHAEKSMSQIDPGTEIEWVGLVFGGLDYQSKSRSAQSLQEESLKRIKSELPEELQSALAEGISSAEARRAELLSSADAKKAENLIAEADSKEQRKLSIEEEQKLLKEQQENNKLTAEEWEKKMKDYDEKYQSAMGGLEKQFMTLERTRASIASSISSAQAEMSRLQLEKSRFRDENGNPVQFSSDPAFTSLLRGMNACQQRLNNYQQQYRQVYGQMQGVYGQAMQTASNFQVIAGDYHKATGNLFKENKNLGKQFSKLQIEEQEIGEAKPNGDTAETKALRRKAGYLSTYVDLNPESESEKLILAHLPEEAEEDKE